MRTLLLLLLSITAAEANAIQVAPSRASDGCVILSLPSLPDGTEYHGVSIRYYGRHTADVNPVKLDRWTYMTRDAVNRGWIEGIICNDSTCTPFKAEFLIAGPPTDWKPIIKIALAASGAWIGVMLGWHGKNMWDDWRLSAGCKERNKDQ